MVPVEEDTVPTEMISGDSFHNYGIRNHRIMKLDDEDIRNLDGKKHLKHLGREISAEGNNQEQNGKGIVDQNAAENNAR